MPIRDYAETPSSNNFLSGIDLREMQMTPAAVNDAIRQQLADTKELQRRATVASASTTAIGAANAEVIDLTGSGVINAFDNVGPGVYRELHVAASPTFTHSANLVMPGAVNFVAAAGDILCFRSGAGGIWKLCGAALADGTAIMDPAAASPTQAKTATDDAAMMTPAKVAMVAGGPWIDLASAATLDLGALASANIRLTGSGVSVTTFGTAPSGLRRKLRLAGTTTFVHSANLVLQTGASITLAADDTALATSLGGGVWFVSDIARAGVTSGQVLRTLAAQFTGIKNFTSNTTIPRDNTQPLSTEGNEIPELTQTLTLTQATNKVRVQAHVLMAAAVPAAHAIAVFRNGTFVTAMLVYSGGAEECQVAVDYMDAPGSVGPHVYTFRVGCSAGPGNHYVGRGSAVDPFFGAAGTAANSILTEISA